jgi:phosphoribosylanthranilate isomerase
MALTIKICGLSASGALEAALEAAADLVGFVFFAPSPRNVGLEAARILSTQVGSRAGKVALTVDANDEFLAGIVNALKPDMLQLHGKETTDRVVAVRTRFGIPVMKALPIATRADLAAIRPYAQVADRLLFDARPPADATRPGGLGNTFDWTLLRGLDVGVPWMLSGGLDPGNVTQAIAVTGARGVDVSSGVESAPGVKDPGKIRAFIRAVREAETPLELPKETIV